MSTRKKRGKGKKVNKKDINTREDAEEVFLVVDVLDDDDYSATTKEEWQLSVVVKCHGMEMMENKGIEQDPVMAWELNDRVKARTRAGDFSPVLGCKYLNDIICYEGNTNRLGRMLEWKSDYKWILSVHKKIININADMYFDSINFILDLNIDGIAVKEQLHILGQPIHASNGVPALELFQWVRDAVHNQKVYAEVLLKIDEGDLNVKNIFVL